MLPDNMFTRMNTIHNIATDKLLVHFCNLKISSKIIWHIVVLMWNNLPDDIMQQVYIIVIICSLNMCNQLTLICTVIFYYLSSNMFNIFN